MPHIKKSLKNKHLYMNPFFRSTAIAITLVITTASTAALAQVPASNYPSRPIRFVVGFAAGGPTDVIARVVGQDMTATLGQTVITENRAGANAQVARSEERRVGKECA